MEVATATAVAGTTTATGTTMVAVETATVAAGTTIATETTTTVAAGTITAMATTTATVVAGTTTAMATTMVARCNKSWEQLAAGRESHPPGTNPARIKVVSHLCHKSRSL